MTDLLIYLLKILWLNLVFLLAFVLPGYPLVSMVLAPTHRSATVIYSAIYGIIGGVAGGLILFASGTYSLLSLFMFMVSYYLLSYLVVHKFGPMRLCIDTIIRPYKSLFRSIRMPLKDTWYALAAASFIAGVLLRYHSALTTSTMAGSDAWGHLYMANNLLNHGVFFANDFYGAYPRGSHIIYCELSLLSSLPLFDVLKFGGPMFGSVTIIGIYALARTVIGKKPASIATALYIVPVLGLLIPPFPVWFGFLFPRQTVAVTEDIGLLFVVSHILLASSLITQFRLRSGIFFALESVAFAYVHPISVLYTTVALFVLGLVYIDTMRRKVLDGLRFAALMVIAPLTVYLYFYTVKAIYGIMPSAVQGEANIVSEASTKLFALPYYNIGPYYTALIISASAVLGYALLKRRRHLAFLTIVVLILAILSCLGIGLFSSPARPIYILNFYVPLFYAILIYTLIHPQRLFNIISTLMPAFAPHLRQLLANHPTILLYPPAIVSMSSTYSVMFYMDTSNQSLLEGKLSAPVVLLLSVIIALIFILILSKEHRLFYAIILTDALSVAVVYVAYGFGGTYIAILTAITLTAMLVGMHTLVPSGDRYPLVLLEGVFIFLAVLYVIPSTSGVRKAFPLLALISITLPGLRKGHKAPLMAKVSLMATIAISIVLYLAMRIVYMMHPFPWYYIAVLMAIPAVIILAATHKLASVNALIVVTSTLFIPFVFSMYYWEMFALSAPFALFLLLWAVKTPENGYGDTWAYRYRVYAFIVALYLFIQLALIYPPVVEYMSSLGLKHFILKVSWVLPEFIPALVICLYYCLCHWRTTAPTLAQQRHGSQLHYGYKDGGGASHINGRPPYTPSMMNITAAVLIFVMVLPPFVNVPEVHSYHYEEWVSNIEQINSEFPPNESAIYSSIAPGFMIHALASDGTELHDFNELLETPPQYYHPTKPYVFICLDKYNYSRFDALHLRYFQDDYWDTPKVYRWLKEYGIYHGPGSVSLYIDKKYTSVYLIMGDYGPSNRESSKARVGEVMSG